MAKLAPSLLASLSLLVACGGKAEVNLTALDCAEEGVNADPFTVDHALADNAGDHEEPGDYSYDASSATAITLSGTSATVSGSGAVASGGVVTIEAAGTYIVSGELSDGQIVVDSDQDGLVRLVLAGASITHSGDAGIRVMQADRAVLVLADGTTNAVTDGSTYPVDAEQNAAVWSDDDLSIGGGGALTVTARFEDGIASKDGLVIGDGTITVVAADEGVRGKDYLVIRGGTLDVRADGDGLQSDEDEDPERGYVLVEGGVITVDAGGDAVSAATDALVRGGTLSLRSGGGARVTASEDTSAKGLKAGVLLVVDDGVIDVDASDDGLHSDGDIVVNGGAIGIATGDDGVHSDVMLTINGGEVAVTDSQEGIEAVAGDLVINGGVIDVTALDDGFNLSGDGDDAPGVESAGDPYDMVFNGGRVSVTSGSDGIDSNGSIVMTGGCLAIRGPVPGTHPEQGAIDYNGSFEISGGVLVAAGAAGRMAQAPSTSSSQPSVAITFSSEQEAGTFVALDDGTHAVAFAPDKVFQSVVISAPWLAVGEGVSVFEGGELADSSATGLADGGTLVGTKLEEAVTLSPSVTAVQL